MTPTYTTQTYQVPEVLHGFTLRDYQYNAIADTIPHILESWESYNPFKRMISSPTGSGKSLVLLGFRHFAHQHNKRVCISSPRVEILFGIMEKAGHELPASQTKRLKMLEEMDLWTPIRLRNRILKGTVAPYDLVIVDESHHTLAATYQILDAMHGVTPTIGLTATPFRASPKQTVELHDMWGEPFVALSWLKAAERGVVSMPTIELRGLFDDDKISIRGSDFQVGGKNGLDALVSSKMDAFCHLVSNVWNQEQRSTMVALPSTRLVQEVCNVLDQIGVPNVPVTQKTKPADREAAFQACINREAVLVQIGVVSEGVDLPIRILIDAKPTLSPVAWQQQLGRITRPVGVCPECDGDREWMEPGANDVTYCDYCDGTGTEPPPLYICTNRNLERHGYLLEGLLPRKTIKQMQEEFEGPSERAGHRQIGLEVLGRYKPITIPTMDGIELTAYNLFNWDNASGKREEYFVVLLPGSNQTLCGRKVSQSVGVNSSGYREMKWGKWERCSLPKDFDGFGTSKAKWPMSEKQRNWWKRDAHKWGLDPNVDVNGRTFSALPFLMNLRMKVA